MWPPRTKTGPHLLGREALDEFGRDGGGVRPRRYRREPSCARRGQAQEDEALTRRHGAALRPVFVTPDDTVESPKPLARTSVMVPTWAAWTTRVTSSSD